MYAHSRPAVHAETDGSTEIGSMNKLYGCLNDGPVGNRVELLIAVM